MIERPLLIFDLDETLIYADEYPLDRASDFTVGNYFVYQRPKLEEFLKKLYPIYDFAIWSSATRDYVQEIARNVFADYYKLQFIWDRSHCTWRFDFNLQQEYYLKNLKRLKKTHKNLARVLILEDDPQKVHRNYGNAIYIKPYHGQIEDMELMKTFDYLNSIHNCENFRKIDKRHKTII